MINNPAILIGVIADDFTGAIDAGVEFVRAGFDAGLRLSSAYTDQTQVEVISTDSRDGDAQTARVRAEMAAEQMRGRRIFKKIDSTMRGHLGEEIAAILRVLGQAKAVVCPAAIEAGRTVREGQLWVHDRLLHHSDFARDPRWPATTADMAQLLGVPTTHLSRADVRAGAEQLARSITNAPTSIVTVDASDQADLEIVSWAALISESVPCGALGLARTWANCQSGHVGKMSDLGAVLGSGAILVVAGSRHPRTRAQIHNLMAHYTVGIEVIPTMQMADLDVATEQLVAALRDGKAAMMHAPVHDLADPSAQRVLLETLGALTLRVCQTVPVGGLVLTGGETASAVSHSLGVAGVRIRGEVEVGVPWGTVIGGVAACTPIVTKAGGFGSEATLVRVVQGLKEV